MKMKTCMFVLSIVVMTLSVAHSSDATHLNNLYEHLFKNYNTLVRPAKDTNNVTNVKVNLNLLSIEELDETKQELVTTGWFYLVWYDHFLSWKREDYGNVTNIQVPPSKIWLPDLMIVNANDKYGQLGGLDLQAMVSYDGKVEWYVGDRRRTSCKVVVTRFPLDHQICKIHVMQWTTTIHEVAYEPTEDPMTFISFEENGEWDITAWEVTESFGIGNLYKKLHFTYTLSRRRAYYIISAILPVTILSLLNLLVFRVPPESGEKLTLCVSVLLSFAVYLTSINESLPEVSDHISIFSIYLNVMFFLKALSVAATVFVLYLFNTPNHTGVGRKVLFKLLCISEHRSQSNLHTESLSLNSNDMCFENDAKVDKFANDVTTTSYGGNDSEWKAMVKRLDLVLFYMFFGFFLMSTLGFFTTIILIEAKHS